MSSYLGGGLASLDRWEGLKEWHKRHQSLLGETNSVTNLEGCNKQFQPLIMDYESDSLASKDASKIEDKLKGTDIFATNVEKHNLSIIPEADEDSRSRDGDFDVKRNKLGSFNNNAAKRTAGSTRNDGNSILSIKASDGVSRQQDNLLSNTTQDTSRVVKRPFLRRGQGLVKYKLQPEDLKNPYRNGSMKQHTFENKGSHSKPSSSETKRPILSKPAKLSIEKPQKVPVRSSQITDFAAPMQRLVLSKPTQNPSPVEIGTWSQVFGTDGKITTEDTAGISQQSTKQDDFRPTFKCETMKIRNPMSPSRKFNSINKLDSSPEEDQESLAAYLDLEQHVGNASFCSTSSKVDRLLSKSSKIHQSNPDAITQTKQLTPMKTGRKFVSGAKDNNCLSDDNQGMWSASDLQNLVKARARRSGSLIKPQSQELKKIEVGEISGDIIQSNVESFAAKKPQKCTEKHSPSEPLQSAQNTKDIDWMLEVLGPVRRPHLMKTMPSIDLNSSLVKNALVPNDPKEKEGTDSETDSSSSASSTEEDSEDDFEQSMKPSPNSTPLELSTKMIESPQTASELPQPPLKLVNDATLEEINYQIESHLSDLRKEIETLQSAKGKTQKYITSLEKKVQELEHRLILEARSYNNRLEEEREAAARRLSEEQAKFSKEKQAFQRTLREERRKAPDPITQQELLRLKQEIATWEEKWRTDRAKARGLESNLRIQITNLKRENEKMKEENNKLRREKENVLSTAKAKASSNTRGINSIAQQLGNIKPKVTIVREENVKLKKQNGNSAYNLKSQTKDLTKSVATIESFPPVRHVSNEWSTDEEIDLGKETSDDDDDDGKGDTGKSKHESSPPISTVLPKHSGTHFPRLSSEPVPFDLEETQAKYDAIFGKSTTESETELVRNGASLNLPPNQEKADGSLPSGNQSSAPNASENEKFVRLIHHPDGKVEQIKENGTRVITYPDGTWKRHSPSGSVMTVPPSGSPVHILYFNGDQLEKLDDGTTRYFYAKTNVWQTTYPDGHEELRYPSGEVERREQSGTVRFILPGAIKQATDEGPVTEDETTKSGISVEKLANGDTLILLPNGERELHTKEYMKKEFLDGTVKFLHKDGSQETRYPSGRIRVKDAHGNLVKDTGITS